MSGHSHFSTIKRKKEATDIQRGKIFSKLAKEISIAAREGSNPDTNSKLRVAIDKAKSINMPRDNIERAAKKGSGEADGEILEEVLFEAYGPGGAAILMKGITDNNNRTVGEVKQILNQFNGKFAASGSVKWLFDYKGIITVSLEGKDQAAREELELKAIEAGAEDTYQEDASLDIYTAPEVLEIVRKNLEAAGVSSESASLGWLPKENIDVSDKERESCQRLFEALNENDAITDVYSNLS